MSSFIYLSGVYFSCMHLNAFVLLNKINIKVSMMFSLQVQTVMMLPSAVSTKLQIYLYVAK